MGQTVLEQLRCAGVVGGARSASHERIAGSLLVVRSRGAAALAYLKWIAGVSGAVKNGMDPLAEYAGDAKPGFGVQRLLATYAGMLMGFGTTCGSTWWSIWETAGAVLVRG